MPEAENIYEKDDIERVAVIGMAGRFPGAKNIAEYWHNIRNGVESIVEFTDDELRAYGVPEEWLKNPNFVKSGTILNDVEKFDASFFGYSPTEVIKIDPQQRIFLELSWEALENAGYTPHSCDGSIGVFAGSSPNDYLSLLPGVFEYSDVVEQMELAIGNEKDNLATRVSYKLNLNGPSMTVQTGCSTSLVAVYLACQSLLSYQCSLALAGGVSVKLFKSKGYFYQEGTIVSPDGHCRPFDANANGTVVGQGVGVVTLKRLSEAMEDGDHILAVIRGCVVNNDGNSKIGYTAPSVGRQAEVIALAHAVSDTPAETIRYIETHGTGTKLGDSIEIAALTQAFKVSTDKRQFCATGSVKSNIGHADIAAGIAGFIKTVLMLKHKEIPPSLNFQAPNPEIDLEKSPFYIPTRLEEWGTDGGPRRAGVSAFGIGGTNAHAVLEEAPAVVAPDPSRAHQLLLISAKSETALEAAARNLAAFIKQHPEISLPDTAFTLKQGRQAFNHRRIVVCRDLEDAVSKLEGSVSTGDFSGSVLDTQPTVAFMFTGQGSQYAGMGRDLYQSESVFRNILDECFDILERDHSIHLRDLLFPKNEDRDEAQQCLTQTESAQPALFAIDYALAKLWMSWGVQPETMIGHSVGEYVAACLCGVFSLEDALKLIAHRGRLIQSLPAGRMLAVPIVEEDISEYLDRNLSLAAVNSSSMCVISGTPEAVGGLHKKLGRQQIESRFLHTSHAFHSAKVEAVMDPFIDLAGEIQFKPPHTPFISNVTGTWISQEEATSPDYWARHMRQTVRYSDGVRELLKASGRVLLEIGPGNALCTLGRQNQESPGHRVILSSMRHLQDTKTDQAFILETLGRLWLVGVDIDWGEYYGNEHRRRIPLPTYPFERERFWPEVANESRGTPMYIDIPAFDKVRSINDIALSTCRSALKATELNRAVDGSGDFRNETEKRIAEVWQRVLRIKHVGREGNYFELGGSSLMAVRVFNQIEKIFGVRLPLATLYEAPTVCSLAKLLSKDIYKPSWASLVQIQAGNSTRPPIFFMHAEGGNILEYYYLVRHLSEDQPFYGLQAIGLEGKRVVALTIEEMASGFIKEIKEVQPTGPYYIGGYCLGGMTAFEMAKQLKNRGDEVALLFLISTSTPNHLSVKSNKVGSLKILFYKMLDTAEIELNYLLAQRYREKSKYFYERSIRLYTILRFKAEEYWNSVLDKINIKTSNYSRAYMIEKTVKLSDKAYMAYEPLPYEGQLTLLYVSRISRLLPKDPYLGWFGLVKKGLMLFKVDAFHKNILLEPHVTEVAHILENEIQRTASDRFPNHVTFPNKDQK